MTKHTMRHAVGSFAVRAVFLAAAISVTAAAVKGPSARAATATSTTATAATSTSSLQQQIDANNQQISDLNKEIESYQTELDQVGADKKTLNAAIRALDIQRNKVEAQISVMQHEINATQLQIQQLGGAITDAQQTIATDQAALGENLRNLQKTGDEPLLMQMLAAGTLDQIWSKVSATIQMQRGVQNDMQALQAQETNLADSRTASQQKQQTLTAQQQSLAAQKQSLTATTQSKSQLLAETDAKESVYEKLLAVAEAELNSFSAFAANAGGSKLLPGQTNCDAWGCYYNQRDALWGNEPLNGTRYNLASDGCLVTSMAMVMTHYGYHDVTPATINANPGDFAAYYPAYLLTTINVDGVSATRRTAGIDATLATGNPVIVGLRAYGGTHYVVLVSGKRGNYVMRDPYIIDGNDISFSAHYSLRDIFSAARVVIAT